MKTPALRSQRSALALGTRLDDRGDAQRFVFSRSLDALRLAPLSDGVRELAPQRLDLLARMQRAVRQRLAARALLVLAVGRELTTRALELGGAVGLGTLQRRELVARLRALRVKLALGHLESSARLRERGLRA
jgi:hypothetical protein